MFIPFGDHYCIRPHAVQTGALADSWALDRERIDGISGTECGLAAVVTKKSPKRLQIAVECIAWYFRRESDYTFVQYCAAERDDETHPIAYLWADDDTLDNGGITTFGACCFRLRTFEDGTSSYALDFVWLHPYHREKGILTKAWPFFRARFGQEFFVLPPFSKAMAAFLKKHGHRPLGSPIENFPLLGDLLG